MAKLEPALAKLAWLGTWGSEQCWNSFPYCAVNAPTIGMFKQLISSVDFKKFLQFKKMRIIVMILVNFNICISHILLLYFIITCIMLIIFNNWLVLRVYYLFINQAMPLARHLFFYSCFLSTFIYLSCLVQ